jgi:quercetin dioxygenase-like cupin family protein
MVAITPEHKVDLWTIQAGQAIPLHMHSDSECIMIVMAGQGEYRIHPAGRTKILRTYVPAHPQDFARHLESPVMPRSLLSKLVHL